MHRRRVCRSKTKEILKLHVNLNIQKDVFWSTKIEDLGNYRYIERLSKKSNNGDFSNFACNEINNLQASNLQI